MKIFRIISKHIYSEILVPYLSIFLCIYIILFCGDILLNLSLSIYLVSTLMLCLLVALALFLNEVAKEKKETKSKIFGFFVPKIIIIIIALIMGYADIYYKLSIIYPDAFSLAITKIGSVYYSVTTFTTTGYGDIIPKSSIVGKFTARDTAKIFAATEMVLGYLVSAFVIGVIVSRYMSTDLDKNDLKQEQPALSQNQNFESSETKIEPEKGNNINKNQKVNGGNKRKGKGKGKNKSSH